MNFITFLFLFSLVIYSFSHETDTPEECGHEDTNTNPIALNVQEDESFINSPASNNSKYPNMRIHASYALLEESPLTTYIKDELIPPVLNYFQAALRIKKPLKTFLRLPDTVDNYCGISSSLIPLENPDIDFLLVIVSSTDRNTSLAARSTVCYRSPSGRPIVARIRFNTLKLSLPNGNSVVHERNIYLAMHEMIHSLGFSKASYKYYVDQYGNKRSDHFRTVTLHNGEERKVLDVEPLTERLRKHIGCASLQGALLEDDGLSSARNSHFERRLFLHEVMTSGVLHGRRVSEFSLALLEGTGWYVPDYQYAEPFFFGQGQGCEFWEGSKVANKPYSEFCTEERTRGCSANGRGGGKCIKDSKSDGYSYYRPMLGFDCENPEAESNARLKGKEVFGREAGSKCFSGTLSAWRGGGKPTSFCFNFECKGKGLNTKLEIKIGNKRVVCNEEGPKKVKGYAGEIMCPDPLLYCNTIAKEYCPRNCMGRGECINNRCKCKPGYAGIDCSELNEISKPMEDFRGKSELIVF